MTADETLNELLVCLFKDLTEIEGRCLITDEFSDISINDMHIIEAIGVDEPKRSGTTLVIVTHEIGFAREVADNVVFMVDGRVVEQGSSVQVLNQPRHERTRRFLARVL